MSLNLLPVSTRRRALVAACCAFALIQLDVTIVNVALARIATGLAVPMAGLQWLVDAYTLSFAGLMLPGGSIVDHWGPRRALAAGMLLFAGASAVCGASGSLAMVVAARAVQGVGAALTMPASMALVRESFDDEAQRARAIGVWGAAGMAAMVAGPLVGGMLLATLSWRSIFWINLPLAGFAGALVLPLGPAAGRQARVPSLASAAFAIAAIASLTGAAIAGPHSGWLGPRTLLLGFGAAVAAAAFTLSERTHSRPLIPAALGRRAPFRAILGAGFAVNLCLYGLMFALSLYWQQLRGWSPLTVGFAFLPLTALGLATSVLAGRWIARRGAREPALWGFGLAGSGFAGLGLVGAQTGAAWLAAALLAIGSGAVLAIMALTTALLAQAKTADAGVASGAFSAARQAGAAVGVALFGALVAVPGKFVDGLHWSAGIAAIIALLCAAVLARLLGEDGSGAATGA